MKIVSTRKIFKGDLHGTWYIIIRVFVDTPTSTVTYIQVFYFIIVFFLLENASVRIPTRYLKIFTFSCCPSHIVLFSEPVLPTCWIRTFKAVSRKKTRYNHSYWFS
jgi:hypothetical protein